MLGLSGSCACHGDCDNDNDNDNYSTDHLSAYPVGYYSVAAYPGIPTEALPISVCWSVKINATVVVCIMGLLFGTSSSVVSSVHIEFLVFIPESERQDAINS